ncbi:hypothetical protein ACJIZ3_023325 [Penstemon smallii]|uniref:Uncharacterized protein n=1 Tax=Penstemon smallii TaxID=265156 RepID=A0ABD3TNS1_9LAMI
MLSALVPRHVRLKNNENQSTYDPIIVSLGPYHHGESDLQVAEEYKHKVLEIYVSKSGVNREFFYNKVLNIVDQVRNYYIGVSISNEALAEMMLLDSCFVVNLMEINAGMNDNYRHFCYHLGRSAFSLIFQDIFCLENQIPLVLIKLLISLIYRDRDGEGNNLINKFLGITCFGDIQCVTNEDPMVVDYTPLHLLEAYHRVFVKGNIRRSASNESTKLPIWGRCLCLRSTRKKEMNGSATANTNTMSYKQQNFRSVMELKSKGIYFRPSPDSMEPSFTPYACFGVLNLPILVVNHNTKSFLSNIIAYEMSPHSDTQIEVTSYVNFMKMLIDGPTDVKELREKEILFSSLSSDEQVVQVFKDLETFGADNENVFREFKEVFDRHCISKAETWMAELIYTYFRTPWTAIALFAAILLLVLTFVQTYFTLRPVKS